MKAVNFSALSGRSRLGRLLRRTLRLIPPTLAVPILQGPLRGKRWLVGSSSNGCWLGSYEQSLQELLAHEIAPGNTVYDIGANVGFYTLLAAVLAGREGRVVAFEPLPANRVFLRRHLALNRIENVEVMDVAIGDRAGEERFNHAPNHTMGHLAADGDLLVHVESLDALYAHGRLPTPNVIKLDVEGAEYRVLIGALTLLKSVRPKLFIELHGVADEECRSLLHTLGYIVEEEESLATSAFSARSTRQRQNNDMLFARPPA